MPWAKTSPRRGPVVWPLLLLAPVLAVVAGLAVALGGIYATVAIAAVVLFLVSLALPLQTLFYVFFGVVFVVVGQLQYFGRIDKAFWIPYLLGLVLYLRLLLFSMSFSPSAAAVGQASGSARLCLWLFGLFLVVAAGSSAINVASPLALFVAGKEYFFLAAVLLAFASGAVGLPQIDKLLHFVPWFLALQVPAVIYQRFVVAARRTGDSPWDAVVGLFGGDPASGGASGTMGMFSLIAMVFALEAWKDGRISGWRTLATCVFALTACALAEVKLVIVLLPVLSLLVFGRAMLRRPVLGVAGLLLGLAMAAGMLSLYQQQYTSTRTLQGRSILAYVESTLTRNVDQQSLMSASGEMGRTTALRFWAHEQSLADPVGLLVGHGVGASRVGTLVTGDLVRHYRMRIGRSALAIHLWEVGLLGALALVASLGVAAVGAWRLSATPALLAHAWQLRGAAVGLLLILLTLPYGPDFVEVAQLQVLAFSLMGIVVAASRLQVRQHVGSQRHGHVYPHG